MDKLIAVMYPNLARKLPYLIVISVMRPATCSSLAGSSCGAKSRNKKEEKRMDLIKEKPFLPNNTTTKKSCQYLGKLNSKFTILQRSRMEHSISMSTKGRRIRFWPLNCSELAIDKWQWKTRQEMCMLIASLLLAVCFSLCITRNYSETELKEEVSVWINNSIY